MPIRTPVKAEQLDRIAALVGIAVGIAAVGRGDDGGVIGNALRHGLRRRDACRNDGDDGKAPGLEQERPGRNVFSHFFPPFIFIWRQM